MDYYSFWEQAQGFLSMPYKTLLNLAHYILPFSHYIQVILKFSPSPNHQGLSLSSFFMILQLQLSPVGLLCSLFTPFIRTALFQINKLYLPKNKVSKPPPFMSLFWSPQYQELAGILMSNNNKLCFSNLHHW